MHTQRDFLLLVMLAATVITPATAQNVPIAVSAASGTAQGAASIPDFSGIWTKPYLGIEPPLSGPGPVINTWRRRQLFDAAGRPVPAASAPLVSNLSQLVGNYANPILKPQAAEAVKRHGEIERRGMPNANPRNQCWPEGVPAVFLDVGIQMLQQPDKITILYDYDHEVRRARMNQSHLAEVTPSWYGDSVGHYEGDTLVIDTVGVKIGPFAMLDWFGTPFTHALHVVERYRLVDYEAAVAGQEWGLKEQPYLAGGGGDSGLVVDPDYKGKGLQLQFTVEDEGVFTLPWSATVTYRRALDVIPENLRSAQTKALVRSTCP
jgi:hypothetical protein